MKRLSTHDIMNQKGSKPIVCLTAYTAPMSKLLDESVDILLVGDSLGMVIYGFDNTLPVTLEMMIAHGAAVVRGSQKALVVVDLPFGSYQASPEQAYMNSVQVLQETGAAAVKLEGGAEMAPTIEFLVQRGIPVMGHIGMQPQLVHVYGSFASRGKTSSEAEKFRQDAKAIEAAGAFAFVIEATKRSIAEEITASVKIPTIGIGASPACDGQVLVIDDVLGLSGMKPKFVKQYADIAAPIREAVKMFSADVRARKFPADENCF